MQNYQSLLKNKGAVIYLDNNDGKKFQRFDSLKDFVEFLELPVAPILDRQERRYIKNLIRPFHDKVEHIRKECVDDVYRHCKFERIVIAINDNNIYTYITLPYFTYQSMYKNIELNKEYTLEELGITFKE